MFTRTESKVHILTCHEGDYDSKVKKRENRNVNDNEKNGAEKFVADQFNPNHNLAKIW